MSFQLNGRTYVLQTKLGKGKQGSSYLYKAGGDLFTVKVVANLDLEQKRKLFSKEVAILRDLQDTCGVSYPCLVDMGYLTPDSSFYPLLSEGKKIGNLGLIIYRFVPGIPLSSLLKDPPDIKVATGLLDQLLPVLVHFQENLIAHRDIKPANIVYDPDLWSFSLIDFGLACEYLCTGLAGSPNYVYPKFLSGHLPSRITDYQQGDIYGLGATVYAYLHHEPPYHVERDGDGNIELGEYRGFRVSVPAHLQEIIEMMMFNPQLGARTILGRWLIKGL